MDPVMFTIFGVDIRWYSVLILIAVIIGIVLLIKEGNRFNISSDFLFNLAFWTIIFGFIGARYYYCVFNYSLYKDNPIDILKIWNGGLAIHGGILAGLLTIIIYCKKYKMSTIKVCDMTVVPLLLAQAIGRWGNFFNGEAHGAAVSYYTLKNMHIPNFIIEGMNINGIYYHPTFLYESIWCLVGFILLLFIIRYKYLKRGMLTCIYLMWYSAGRFFIESLRTDSLMIGGFKQAQILSVLLFVIGLCVFMVLSRKSRFEDLYNEEQVSAINF